MGLSELDRMLGPSLVRLGVRFISLRPPETVLLPARRNTEIGRDRRCRHRIDVPVDVWIFDLLEGQAGAVDDAQEALAEAVNSNAQRRARN
jgi:hypothetical protein